MIARVTTVNGYVYSPIGSIIIGQGKSIVLQLELPCKRHSLIVGLLAHMFQNKLIVEIYHIITCIM